MTLYLAQVRAVSSTLASANSQIITLQKYPHSHIVGMSNSQTQREHILSVASARGLNNVEVGYMLDCARVHTEISYQIITADISVFDFPADTRFVCFKMLFQS